MGLVTFEAYGSENHLVEVNAAEILNAIADGQNIDIGYARITGFLDVLSAARQLRLNGSEIFIPGNISIRYCEICGNVRFESCHFGGSVYFDSTFFDGNVNFKSARFGNEVSFRDSILHRNTSFELARFNGNASFNKTSFAFGVCFKGAIFDETADFSMMSSGNAALGTSYNRTDFGTARFSKDAFFKSVIFGGIAFFNSSVFNGDSDFRASTFVRIGDFKSAVFNGNVYFVDIVIEHGTENKIDFSLARFNKCLLFNNLHFRMCSIT